MAQWHRELRMELEARIPRGASGSPQSQFRGRYWFHRSQGNSFEASVEMAAAGVRKQHPDFAPDIRPLVQ